MTMRPEIDILARAAAKECVIVEKVSRAPWTPQQLAQAQKDGRFQEPSDLFPPDRDMEADGPLLGGGPGIYRAVGQTRHFLILVALEPIQPPGVSRQVCEFSNSRCADRNHPGPGHSS
jgi:hypothetical protein